MTASQYPIFDGHNDSLSRYLFPRPEDGNFPEGYDFFGRNPGGHLDLPRAREGGFAAGFFAAFATDPATATAPPPDRSKYMQPDGSYAFPLAAALPYDTSVQSTLAGLAQTFRVEAQSGGQFKICRTVNELETCLQNGVIAAVLHIEGAEALDSDLHLLEVLFPAGLRSLGIVWSRPNIFGAGVPFAFPHSPDTGPGLTDAGKRLVRRCNELGILLDLSHLNERGFWDVAALSDAPLVATHSNAWALCRLTRNLTDKQLAAIRERDGMVGVNFGNMFLREDGTRDTSTPLSTIVRHIDYLVEHVGIDRVGFGSDFDGTTLPAALGDAAGLPALVQALSAAGYDDAALRKITHENWLRVLRKTWKS